MSKPHLSLLQDASAHKVLNEAKAFYQGKVSVVMKGNSRGKLTQDDTQDTQDTQDVIV